MTLERVHITALVGIAAFIWMGVLISQGTPVSWDHARPFSIVVSSLVGVGLLFEFVLWHQPAFHGWFFRRPDLRGTWRAEIQSGYLRSENSERVATITCYIGVTQTLSTLKMHLMTPESESWLIADHIRPSQNGNGFQLLGVYTNEPNIHLRGERASEIHHGAIVIETHGESLRSTTLTAKYWTDRKTTGTIDFTKRTSKLFTRLAEAESAFNKPSDPSKPELP